MCPPDFLVFFFSLATFFGSKSLDSGSMYHIAGSFLKIGIAREIVCDHVPHIYVSLFRPLTAPSNLALSPSGSHFRISLSIILMYARSDSLSPYLVLTKCCLVAGRGAIVEKWFINIFANYSNVSTEYGANKVNHMWAWSLRVSGKSRHLVASVAPIEAM